MNSHGGSPCRGSLRGRTTSATPSARCMMLACDHELVAYALTVVPHPSASEALRAAIRRRRRARLSMRSEHCVSRYSAPRRLPPAHEAQCSVPCSRPGVQRHRHSGFPHSPSITTMTSISPKVCSSALRTARSKSADRLRVGITTLISGLGKIIYRFGDEGIYV